MTAKLKWDYAGRVGYTRKDGRTNPCGRCRMTGIDGMLAEADMKDDFDKDMSEWPNIAVDREI